MKSGAATRHPKKKKAGGDSGKRRHPLRLEGRGFLFQRDGTTVPWLNQSSAA